MKKLISLAVLAALGAASQAQASVTVNINPDAGGVDPVITVGALDWTVSSALSVADAGQSIGAPSAYVGQQFTTYSHGTLATFNNGAGTPLGGLNLNGVNPANAYEWTFVTGFREQFTSISSTLGAGGSAFDVVAGAPSFFEIWFDATPDANPLSGKGFNNGIKILSGHYVGGSGSFVATQQSGAPLGTPEVGALDQFGTNDYAGLQTVTGNGNSTGTIRVDWVDTAYFLSAPAALNIDYSSQQKLAFQQTDPSACFWTGSGYLGGAGSVSEGCANTIGGLNGVSGPNVEFQTDANNNFAAAVPEPGSLALLGLGFAAVGMMRRKSQG